MKTGFCALVTLAAVTELASATFGGAPPFTSPYNTNNECNPQQQAGFDWSSLQLGPFSNYGDFNFSGFSCAGSFGSGVKRGLLTGRTFQDKVITGKASRDKKSCPKFGVGSSDGVKDFSVIEFQLSTEFDADLELHYEMPDQSTCKQMVSCKAGGSVIKNEQCGGAQDVIVVYPPQDKGPGKDKEDCSIGIHSMSFDCKPPITASTTRTSSKTKSTLASTPAIPSSPVNVPVTTPAVSLPTPSLPSHTADVPETTPAESSTSVAAIPSSSADGPGTTRVPEVSTTASSSSSIGSLPSIGSVTTPVSVGTTPIFRNSSTLDLSTELVPSTVFATSTSTLSSCGPDVPNCPISSTSLSTNSFPILTTSSNKGIASTPVASPPAIVTPLTSQPPIDAITAITSTSTTVCPVTLTHVTGGSTIQIPTTISHTNDGTISLQISSFSSVIGGTTSLQVGSTTSTILSTITSTICTKCQVSSTPNSEPGPAETASYPIETPANPAETPSNPVQNVPYPELLPSCLNTWLFTEGCSSNTDSECYCPSESFITKVFQCLSAHGVNDDEVASAKDYLQGICAAQIPSNPAIVTAAPPVHVTPATSPSAPVSIPVMTVPIYVTLVVPCVESTGSNSGSTIPSRTTTTTISTTLTVPQVVFTTYPIASGAAIPSADLVPGAPVSAPTSPTSPTYSTYPAAPLPPLGSTTLAIVSPTSNGTNYPTSSLFPFVNGGIQNTATFGGAFGALIVAFLVL